MRYLIFISLFFVVGSCGPIKPTIISGNNLSTEHGLARIEDALKGAEEYCASIGKDVKLVRTDCPYRCMSSFECVKK